MTQVLRKVLVAGAADTAMATSTDAMSASSAMDASKADAAPAKSQ